MREARDGTRQGAVVIVFESDIPLILRDLEIPVDREMHKSDGSTEYYSQCPHHFSGEAVDNSPSWSINDSGQHLCFSCGWGGGLMTLVADVLGITYDAAKAWLAPRTDVLATLMERDAWGGTSEPRVVVAPINEARLRSYELPPTQALTDRQITAESCAAYDVKWDLQKSAWILPIRTDEGLVLGWQVKGHVGREFKNFPVNVPKSTALFGLQTLDGTGQVWLVESPLDAVRLHGLGYKAVSSYGASVSDKQMRLLIENSETVIMALDNDKAGQTSTLKILGMNGDGSANRFYDDYSQRIRMTVFNYGLSEHKDVGDMHEAEITWGRAEARHSIERERCV